MSNISKVTNRHVWQEQRLHNPSHPKVDRRGFAPGLLCINCRKPWFEEQQGSPPLVGCASGVNLKHAGPSRLKDHHEQEMRIREAIESREEPMPDIEFIKVPRELVEGAH